MFYPYILSAGSVLPTLMVSEIVPAPVCFAALHIKCTTSKWEDRFFYSSNFEYNSMSKKSISGIIVTWIFAPFIKD